MINAYHEYSQVTLNDSLLDLYFKKSAQGTISNIPSTVIDYHFNPNPWPKNVNIWSMLIQNIVVPERIFIVFQTEKNRSSSKGNSFYYENMGLTEINFSVMSVSQNRYNQKRTSAFSKDEKLVVKSSEAYESLTENEKFYADLITKDIILKSNILNSGKSNVGINQSITFVCNELSVYEGQCVYSISTNAQMSSSTQLREVTRKGNIEITFHMREATTEAYHCSAFCLYPGEFLVSFFSSKSVRNLSTQAPGLDKTRAFSFI